MKADKNDILSVVDYDTVMRIKGYFIGYYGSTVVKDVVEEVKGKLGDNIFLAKGLYIAFYTNKDFPIKEVATVFDGIEALLNKDTCVNFDIIIDNSITKEILEYEVLLSGLNKI